MFQLFGARTPGGAMIYRLVIIERALDLILKALSVEYREDLTDQLANLVAACQKIEAIKLYRAQTGSTLEAKDAVERWPTRGAVGLSVRRRARDGRLLAPPRRWHLCPGPWIAAMPLLVPADVPGPLRLAKELGSSRGHAQLQG